MIAASSRAMTTSSSCAPLTVSLTSCPRARELVDQHVDVILTIGNINTVRAAQEATQTIPIVFTNFRDPVMLGIVADLARPGGNVTGSRTYELTPKRLELLKETVPGLTRLSVLGNTLAYEAYEYYREIVGYAQAVGIEYIEPCPFNWFGTDDWLAVLAEQRPHAVIDFNGYAGYAARPPSMRRLLDFALERRLPAVYGDARFTRAGGLMSVQSNERARWQMVARQIEKLLKGANPAELPVEHNDQYDLVLNLATARAIGVTFPDSVRLQAKEIIQ